MHAPSMRGARALLLRRLQFACMDLQLPPLALTFSTLAFPSETLSEAVALGSELGYQGVELRLIDSQLIEPATLNQADRVRVQETVGALPIIAIDSSIRLTETEPSAIVEFLHLAHDWECPVVRVFGGTVSENSGERMRSLLDVVDVLEQVADVAQRLGVNIGIETHDSFSAGRQVAENPHSNAR